MYFRLIAAAISVILLCASHWSAYTKGKAAIKAEYQQKAIASERQARAREIDLAKQNEKVDHELQKQKAVNANLARINADRLREYEAAINQAKNSIASSRANDAIASIASECGSAITAMDTHARAVETIAKGLQSYISSVCLASDD